MRKKYFGEEYVVEFIWNNADTDGIWDGDAATIAAEFDASEDEAYATLEKLCDGNRIQRVGAATYIITRWRERDEIADREAEC